MWLDCKFFLSLWGSFRSKLSFSKLSPDGNGMLLPTPFFIVRLWNANRGEGRRMYFVVVDNFLVGIDIGIWIHSLESILQAQKSGIRSGGVKNGEWVRIVSYAKFCFCNVKCNCIFRLMRLSLKYVQQTIQAFTGTWSVSLDDCHIYKVLHLEKVGSMIEIKSL